jgi:hypothetical protein
MAQPIDISVIVDGKEYKGWATPSDKNKEDGSPKSFHVVLNDVMFGNISHSSEKTWTVDEQRPQELVEAVGKYLEKHL